MFARAVSSREIKEFTTVASHCKNGRKNMKVVVVVVVLFYVHGKHLRSCRDGQLT